MAARFYQAHGTYWFDSAMGRMSNTVPIGPPCTSATAARESVKSNRWEKKLPKELIGPKNNRIPITIAPGTKVKVKKIWPLPKGAYQEL